MTYVVQLLNPINSKWIDFSRPFRRKSKAIECVVKVRNSNSYRWASRVRRRGPDALMHMLDDIENQVHNIYGACTGVCIYQRSEGDNHLCFVTLIEDDGNWFVSTNGVSTFWLPDFTRVMSAAESWLEANAIRTKWGWELSPALSGEEYLA